MGRAFRYVGRRRRLTTALLVLAASLVFWVVAAAADSPDVSNAAGATTVATVQDNGNGTSTVTVSGGWVWFTHNTDCNTDRAGTGFAVDWNDSQDGGFHVTTLNGTSIDVGSVGNLLNPVDNTVHSTPIVGTGNGTDVSDPSLFANWRSGCGTADHFFNGKNRSEGTWGPISHVYSTPNGVSDLQNQTVCVLTYDVHKGTTVNGGGGNGGIPKNASEITAGGTGHNGDNSAEKNAQTPAGNVCATIHVGELTTQASASNEALAPSDLFDTAFLNGVTDGAQGTITFNLYKNDPQCDSEPVFGPDVVSVDGPGSYQSDTYQGADAGTYYWQATYSGDQNNPGPVSTPCNPEDGTETTTVTEGQVPPTITIDKVVSPSDDGGTFDFTISNDEGSIALDNDEDGYGNGESTGAVDVLPGTHTITESGNGNTNASDYTSTWSCSNEQSGDGVTINLSELSSGQNVTCTFTNTRIPPPPPPPPPPPSAPPATPAPPKIDLAITKAGSPNPATVGNQITWAETVTNNGPNGATGVTVADPVPTGTTFVSATSSQGTCTGGALVSCSIGSMAAGASVSITIVTTANVTGTINNTATTVGNEAETNTANNTASASVQVNGAFVPPKVKPTFCTAVRVSPKTLFVGRVVVLKMKVAQNGKAVSGIHVKIKGAKLSIVSKASNKAGIVTVRITPKKAGIVTIIPVAKKSCSNPRIGVTGVFTPPVTG